MEVNNSNTPDDGGAAPITPRQQYLNIIQKGFALLKEQKRYKQSNVVHKLQTLQCDYGPALFSQIITKNLGGEDSLNDISVGIKEIIYSELGYVFDEKQQIFIHQPEKGWTEKIIPDSSIKSASIVNGVYVHADGRLDVGDKTRFFADAQEEVIEIGVRLNTFTNYFTSQKPSAGYKYQVIELLKRGVNFKAYLLHPDSAEASVYFADRAKKQKDESRGTTDIQRIIERLYGVVDKIGAMNLPGKFEIYKYRHIPYGNFFVVDGGKPQGKMLVSPYIYGVERANSPVLEFSRKSNPALYLTFWDSVKAFVDKAELIAGDPYEEAEAKKKRT